MATQAVTGPGREAGVDRPEPDAESDGWGPRGRVVRRSAYAEVREYPGSRATMVFVHTCPACSERVGPGTDLSLSDHLLHDHGPEDFGLSPLIT